MKRKTFPCILVILWMTLIFYLFHQPATKSNGLSKGATEIIVETVEKLAPKIDINKGSFNHIKLGGYNWHHMFGISYLTEEDGRKFSSTG